MERDARLVLAILRYVRERSDGASPLPEPDLDGYGREEVNGCVGLCAEAGHVRASTAGTDDGLPRYSI